MKQRALWVAGALGVALPLGACGLTPPPSSGSPSGVQATSLPSASVTREEAPSTPSVKAADFSDAEQAALRIRNIGCGGVSVGSGFAISDHVLVTNRHVVGGASTLEVSTYDGRDITVEAVSATNIADLALVLTDQELPRTIKLATKNPAIGSTVTAVGYPEGGELTTSEGQVLSYDADPIGWSKLPMLVNDAPIEHGSSGSPLINSKGELVGIVYAGEGKNKRQYAVPVEVLDSLIDSLDGLSDDTNCDGTPTGQVPDDVTKCGDGIYAGEETSCPFAREVARTWKASGGNRFITAHSPVTGLDYELYCDGTDPVICVTDTGASVYLRR